LLDYFYLKGEIFRRAEAKKVNIHAQPHTVCSKFIVCQHQ